MSGHIVIVGAHENNLKRLDLHIPKEQLVVVTGVSGSGKSSLVFDTIAVEAMREWNETLPSHVRARLPHHERPRVELIDHLTPTIVIDQRPFSGNVRSTVGTMTDLAPMLRLLFARCADPTLGSSSAYSFNDPNGMCPACGGLGKAVRFDMDKVLDTRKSLNEGAIRLPGFQVGTYQSMLYVNSGLFDPDTPLADFSDQERTDLLHGSGVNVTIQAKKGRGIWTTYNLAYEGLQDRIDRLYLNRDVSALSPANRRIVGEYTIEEKCAVCRGSRLALAALESRLAGLNIAEAGDLEILDLARFAGAITDPVARPVAAKLEQGLLRIADLGLEYLNLNRSSTSLSGGESQRLKMVRHLGSSLVGLTYVFDEPTVGLHPGDVDRLSRLLRTLRDRKNSVLVVEHDRDIIRLADHVIEMGPHAGRDGGRVIFDGPVSGLLEEDTPTAKHLNRLLPVQNRPRRATGILPVRHARLHNLRDISLDIPTGVLTVVSGVAGSGKSSLICGELLRQHPDVVHISQAAIGTSSRSTPATYVGIMDEIRRLFARANSVGVGLFSSASAGACPVCRGKGVIQTEMAFMDPVTTQCEECEGTRYRPDVLRYLLDGRSILDVLSLTVDEAAAVFVSRPTIHGKLSALQSVGMGYVTLGQSTATLSGGEAQRVKLASHLGAREAVYALDEPTTGLHGSDVDVLMALLNRLVDHGNTVIVVEHDLDVVGQADWVIDMGPGGGKNGGTVVFEGTPGELLRSSSSVTAEYLRRDCLAKEST